MSASNSQKAKFDPATWWIKRGKYIGQQTDNDTVDPEDLQALVDAAVEEAKSAGPAEPVAYIEHHKGGDNLTWDRIDHPYAKATPLYKNAAPQVPALHKGDHDSRRDDQPARASSEAGDRSDK